jgi:hypothetical protein
MRKQMKWTFGLVAAVVAFAGAGTAAATGTHATHKAHKVAKEKVGGVDTDTIQSGDQTSPDKKGAKSSALEAETPEGAPESASETSAPESAATDAPGGHEDPEGTEVENQEG